MDTAIWHEDVVVINVLGEVRIDSAHLPFLGHNGKGKTDCRQTEERPHGGDEIDGRHRLSVRADHAHLGQRSEEPDRRHPASEAPGAGESAPSGRDFEEHHETADDEQRGCCILNGMVGPPERAVPVEERLDGRQCDPADDRHPGAKPDHRYPTQHETNPTPLALPHARNPADAAGGRAKDVEVAVY